MTDGINLRALSLLHNHGEHAHACGYCHAKTETSISHGMTAYVFLSLFLSSLLCIVLMGGAQKLSVHDYQALLDRGWRRSGDYVVPILHYTR